MVVRDLGLVWKGPDQYGVEAIAAPANRPGWVEVDVAYAGICGSDLHICAGHHSRARVGIVLGHEFVGRLAQAAAGHAAGQPVFVNPMIACGNCDACARGLVNVCQRLTAIGVDFPGAIARRLSVPEANLFPLPPDADLARFALTEPLAVCVRALKRTDVQRGTKVRVVGAGPIGVLLALLAQHRGADVELLEPAQWRRSQAEALGLTSVAERAADQWADVVFDAAGHPSVSPRLTGWTRPGGSVVIVGAYAPGEHPFNLLAVNFAELTIIGTRIYTEGDIDEAIALLDQTDIFDPIITSRVALTQAADAISALKRAEGLKVLIEVAP